MANNDYITTLSRALVAYVKSQDVIVAEAAKIHAEVHPLTTGTQGQPGREGNGTVPTVGS